MKLSDEARDWWVERFKRALDEGAEDLVDPMLGQIEVIVKRSEETEEDNES